MSALIACASHLLVDLPLFGGPALLVLAGLFVMARNERRRAGRAEHRPVRPDAS